MKSRQEAKNNAEYTHTERQKEHNRKSKQETNYQILCIPDRNKFECCIVLPFIEHKMGFLHEKIVAFVIQTNEKSLSLVILFLHFLSSTEKKTIWPSKLLVIYTNDMNVLLLSCGSCE